MLLRLACELVNGATVVLALDGSIEEEWIVDGQPAHVEGIVVLSLASKPNSSQVALLATDYVEIVLKE